MGRVKILVVEDEIITAEHIKITLEDHGYQVAGLVGSGEEAISKVEDLDVDLVLMDIHLKGKMGGIEAAKIINNHSGIPVIFLTAYSPETVKLTKITETSASIDKETFGILKKPFEEDELHSTIEIALNRNKNKKN